MRGIFLFPLIFCLTLAIEINISLIFKHILSGIISKKILTILFEKAIKAFFIFTLKKPSMVFKRHVLFSFFVSFSFEIISLFFTSGLFSNSSHFSLLLSLDMQLSLLHNLEGSFFLS